jgi:hypothetical protein
MAKGRQFRERLQYQLRYIVDRVMFPAREEADKAVERAKRQFQQTGRSIPGVKIEARWRNPDNRQRRHQEWKSTTDSDQSLVGFWVSIGKKVF